MQVVPWRQEWNSSWKAEYRWRRSGWLESFAGRGTKEAGTGLIQWPHTSFADSRPQDGRGVPRPSASHRIVLREWKCPLLWVQHISFPPFPALGALCLLGFQHRGCVPWVRTFPPTSLCWHSGMLQCHCWLKVPNGLLLCKKYFRF